jgi:molybdenum cofactor synthesis domain-containing protein
MSENTVSMELAAPLRTGEFVHACSGGSIPGWAIVEDRLSGLRAGDRLEADDTVLQVLTVGWLPGGPGEASRRLYYLKAERDVPAGKRLLAVVRPGYALAWITLSDKGAAGKRTDESGPLVGSLVAEKLDLGLVQGFIIPDELAQLKGLMVDLALVQGFDLILTTGGTGVGPRDITPEATLAVIEKRLPGFERAMTAASLVKTPHGAISRAVAGTLGQAVIVNMPGSPKAVAECLDPLLPTFRHTLEKLQGDPSDCAVLRK